MSSRDLAISHSFLLSQELNSFIRVAGMESNSISCPLVEVLMNSEVVKGSQRVKFWKLNQTKTCIAPLPQRDANTWDTGMSAHKVKANLQKNICPLGSLACYKPVLPRTHTHFLVIGRPGLGHTPFLSEVFNFYRSPASKKEWGALFLPDLRATRDCLSLSQIYLGVSEATTVSTHRQGSLSPQGSLVTYILVSDSSEIDVYFSCVSLFKNLTYDCGEWQETPMLCPVSLKWLHLDREDIHFLGQQLLPRLPAFFLRVNGLLLWVIMCGHNLCSLDKSHPNK